MNRKANNVADSLLANGLSRLTLGGRIVDRSAFVVILRHLYCNLEGRVKIKTGIGFRPVHQISQYHGYRV